MSAVYGIDGDTVEVLDAAERALEAGGCLVFPTDTVYGLAARPDLVEATDRIFEIKHRPRGLTLPVLVAGTADAQAIARFDERAMTLAHEFWPGGLTLVLPRREGSLAWNLGEERETIGVRVPASGLAVALLARTGPLAVTSANRSGEPTPATCEAVREALGDAVDLYICGGAGNGDVPSTVVDLTADEPRLLRAGVVPPDDVFTALSAA